MNRPLYAFLILALCTAWQGWTEDRPKNVLLILVDDLKPAIGAYGDPYAKTPNIDCLAARGVRFERAYCNQSVCAPSRYNLMLGARSTSTGLYGLGRELRDAFPNAVTMPQHFSQHGYRAEAIGKIFHVGHGNHGDDASWSEPPIHEKVVEYLSPESTAGGQLTREEAYFNNQRLGEIRSLPKGMAWEATEVEDEGYADGRIAAAGIEKLRKAKDNAEQPFFLALGFVKPHLPFTAPQKYWDLHDPDAFPLPEFTRAPKNGPRVAYKVGGEIVNYAPLTVENLKEESHIRKLIHGYYAAASYADAQIGKILDELDRLELWEDTIIALWGDHGWHLGDHGIWTKHTNYEQANRIPMIFVAPGVTSAGGVVNSSFAETVDIFPTLSELAGLPAPKGPQPIDGLSLVPTLKNIDHVTRDHAYHCYPRGAGRMGRAIRTERYRLVEWKRPGEPTDSAEFELYDYVEDPLETVNIADSSPEVIAKLSKLLARQPEAAARQ